MSRRAVVASSEIMHSIWTAAVLTAADLGANDFAIWFLRQARYFYCPVGIEVAP